MKLIRYTLLIAAMCFPAIAFSGPLLHDARILEVMNSYDGGKEFAIRIDTHSATGPCSDSSYIVFPEPDVNSSTLSKSAFDQAFTMAQNNIGHPLSERAKRAFRTRFELQSELSFIRSSFWL